jgi:hypothetical protein
MTMPISLRVIVSHLMHWNLPQVQKFVVRIVWMVPLYSVESWLSLRFRSFALQIETLRWCYESYVIYSFLYFLISALGDEHRLICLLKEKPAERGNHMWPFKLCLYPWSMGHEFFHNCKIGVLQYVVIQNVLALIIVMLEGFHKYDEGRFRFDRGYLYICVISSLSQMWALYCLAQFYFATREDLQPWRPLGKFLCVKLVRKQTFSLCLPQVIDMLSILNQLQLIYIFRLLLRLCSSLGGSLCSFLSQRRQVWFTQDRALIIGLETKLLKDSRTTSSASKCFSLL